MTVRYAVPSHHRADTLTRKTLPLLASLGVPATAIDVWVNPDQAADYARTLPVGTYGSIRDVTPTGRVGAARNAIARGYPVGTRLIEIDDDVTRVAVGWRGCGLTTVDADLWRRITDYAWTTADRYGLGLWGPYPVFNHYFMRPTATTDLRYVTGTLFGTDLRGDDTELVTLDDKEDFQRNIKHTIRDGGVLRLNWLAYQTNYYGEPGGMQTYRTPELVDDGALRLAAMYPDHCTYAGNVGKNGNAEVRLTRGTPAGPPPPVPHFVMEAIAHD